ncbi:MAG: DUF6356 family protein [Granulosicoccus sp.]
MLSNQPSPVSNWRKSLSVFSAHPASVGESYFEHQRKALGFAGALAYAALAATVHAFIPALCVSTARNRIAELHSRLQKRATTEAN